MLEGLHDMMGRVADEASRAQERYGDFASMHEGYGVLAEEIAELLDAIRMRQNEPGRAMSIETEALQVSAVAMRMAEQAHRVIR